MKTTLATVSTDSTGMIVTMVRGSQRIPQFFPNWQGLQFILGGQVTKPVTVLSVDSPRQMTLAAPVQGDSGPMQFTNVPLSPTRETIYQAFFNVLKTVPGVLTSSRRTPPTSGVDPASQPALFMEQVKEDPKGERGTPYYWALEVVIELYVFVGDENASPVTVINPMIDFIEQTFPGEGGIGLPNQLTGLVDEVRLIGGEHAGAGSLGPQAFAHIPVRIVAL